MEFAEFWCKLTVALPPLEMTPLSSTVELPVLTLEITMLPLLAVPAEMALLMVKVLPAVLMLLMSSDEFSPMGAEIVSPWLGKRSRPTLLKWYCDLCRHPLSQENAKTIHAGRRLPG